jgi:hypothetical protein
VSKESNIEAVKFGSISSIYLLDMPWNLGYMKLEIRKQVEHLVLAPGGEDMERGAKSVLVKAVASAGGARRRPYGAGHRCVAGKAWLCWFVGNICFEGYLTYIVFVF